MATRVRLDPATGTATVTLVTPLPAGQNLKLSLCDLKSRRYLTPTGWSTGRKTLIEVTPEAGQTDIVIDAAAASLLSPGMNLLLEEIFINLREQFVWPDAAPAPAVAAVEPSDEPVTAAVEATSPEPPVESPSPERSPRPARRHHRAGDASGGPGCRCHLVHDGSAAGA